MDEGSDAEVEGVGEEEKRGLRTKNNVCKHGTKTDAGTHLTIQLNPGCNVRFMHEGSVFA